jgi:hypothetical protein
VKQLGCVRVVGIGLLLCISQVSGRAAQAESQNSSSESAVSQPISSQSSSRVDISSTGDAQQTNPAQVQPDNHVLSGAEAFGLGSLNGFRQIFDPALQVSEFGQSGVVGRQLLSMTGFGGSLDVEQHRGRYGLTATYHGAETIYQPSYAGLHYLPYHDGAISQELFLGRWILRFRDDFLYSREAGFSGLFTGGPAQSSTVVNNLQPSSALTGTIETGLARQIYNTTVGEIDYGVSRQSTVTLVGFYGLAHFFDTGYIDTRDARAIVGYNYSLSVKNSLAVRYDLDDIEFIGTGSRIQTDSPQLAFGRKVTGRLALQVAAGPQAVHLEDFGSSSGSELSWNASGALTYAWTRRTGSSLSVFRGVSAGSGVFFGAETESTTASIDHEFTRSLSGSINGGYSANKSLVSIPTFASQFNVWFAGANLNQRIGRNFSLSMSYGFEQQTSGGGTCPVSSCGLPGSFSEFGATFQWRPLIQGR